MKQKYIQTVKMPPIDWLDYNVDIQINIGFKESVADIIAFGQKQRGSIEMSPQALEKLNKRLQEKIEAVTSANVEEQELTPEVLEKELRPLVEVGHYAFKQVFSDDKARTTIQELLSLFQRPTIEISSGDFFLPWELLYSVSLDQPLSYEHFWGFNCIIYRCVLVDRISPPRIPVPPVKLGLLTYSGLTNVVDGEIPFFQKLERDGKIILLMLRPLNPEEKQEELKEFLRFWHKAFDVVHFACHAFYDVESPEMSSIRLSDEFPISLQDMEVYGITINGHPLIIMNACETGNLNPLYTAHFAAAFLKYGARGVVATECAVPDAFAADFAQQLYAHLLVGEPLGESLLATRRYFLEKYHNPSGLLYSMYAPPSIRLAHKGG